MISGCGESDGDQGDPLVDDIEDGDIGDDKYESKALIGSRMNENSIDARHLNGRKCGAVPVWIEDEVVGCAAPVVGPSQSGVLCALSLFAGQPATSLPRLTRQRLHDSWIPHLCCLANQSPPGIIAAKELRLHLPYLGQHPGNGIILEPFLHISDVLGIAHLSGDRNWAARILSIAETLDFSFGYGSKLTAGAVGSCGCIEGC